MVKTTDPSTLGNFEEYVMLAVIRAGERAYGMAVRRELEVVTERAVTIGSVYATLDRLEAKGLVESWRTTIGGDAQSRRVFGVTAAGTRALAETRALRDKLWDGVRLRTPLRHA